MLADVRFHHVSLVIADVSVALEFYRDLLGLEVLDRPTMSFQGAWLSLGSGLQLHLLQVPNPDSIEGRPDHGGRDRHLALSVADLSWYESRLASHKV